MLLRNQNQINGMKSNPLNPPLSRGQEGNVSYLAVDDMKFKYAPLLVEAQTNKSMLQREDRKK